MQESATTSISIAISYNPSKVLSQCCLFDNEAEDEDEVAESACRAVTPLRPKPKPKLRVC
jgi:hypothetical protein